MDGKRIYRSRKNKIICGVGGGIAEYLDVDPTLVRLVILLVMLSGTGILLYLGAALIIPMELYENE